MEILRFLMQTYITSNLVHICWTYTKCWALKKSILLSSHTEGKWNDSHKLCIKLKAAWLDGTTLVLRNSNRSQQDLWSWVIGERSLQSLWLWCFSFLHQAKKSENSTRAPTEASELTKIASTFLAMNNKQKGNVGHYSPVYLMWFACVIWTVNW